MKIRRRQPVVKSIRTRFTLTLIGVVTIISMVFSAIVIVHNVRTIDRQLQETLKYSLDRAEWIMGKALWEYNREYVDYTLDSLFSSADIVCGRVLVEGKVYAVKTRSGYTGGECTAFSKPGDFYFGERKIFFNEQPVGVPQLAVSRKLISRTVYGQTASALILLILILFSVFITLFL